MHCFATEDHDHHRQRRGAMARFFSKGQITKLEPVIQAFAQRLCDRLLERRDTHEPFDVTMAYSCYTTDAISAYCFGEPFGYLEQKDFEPNFRRPTYATLNQVHITKHFPFLKIMFAAEPMCVPSIRTQCGI
jgi:cytochrome P450